MLYRLVRFLYVLMFVICFRYPHCLYFLELLQNPNFRSAMAHPANKVNQCDKNH